MVLRTLLWFRYDGLFALKVQSVLVKPYSFKLLIKYRKKSFTFMF